jgi:dihydrolipoamide dehydrogenase
MKEYDISVVGSGTGMNIVDEVLDYGASVALVDKGPRIGGTCLNYGCIPSKMLIHVADRIMEIRKAAEFGIDVSIRNIDFDVIMNRMRTSRDTGESGMRETIRTLEGLDFYEGRATFTADYILEINGEQIKGDKIFLATGSRPVVPPIQGLNEVNYLTNETVLELDEQPESLIIIGGGYIGVEYGHFFEAIGTKVTIIEMADRLILSEEPEIADLLLRELRKRMDILLSAKLIEVKKNRGGVTVVTEDTGTGIQSEITAEAMMLAIGRRSNADLIKAENTGITIDEKGFIQVNE